MAKVIKQISGRGIFWKSQFRRLLSQILQKLHEFLVFNRRELLNCPHINFPIYLQNSWQIKPQHDIPFYIFKNNTLQGCNTSCMGLERSCDWISSIIVKSECVSSNSSPANLHIFWRLFWTLQSPASVQAAKQEKNGRVGDECENTCWFRGQRSSLFQYTLQALVPVYKATDACSSCFTAKSKTLTHKGKDNQGIGSICHGPL